MTKAFKLPALSTFGAWAAKQPPNREYNYSDPQGCPIALFLQSLGYPEAHCGSYRFSLYDGYAKGEHKLPKLWNGLVLNNVTYGALAKRIEAAVKRQRARAAA
jgi:hypothetical protein